MIGYVLDASVAVKGFLPADTEEFSERVDRLLYEYGLGLIRLVVPDSFWPEVGNVFWKSVRSGRMSPEDVRIAIGGLLDLRLESRPCEPLIPKALDIALHFNRTVYDSIYVALALNTGLPLITADERLVNALGAHYPVRWLGGYNPPLT